MNSSDICHQVADCPGLFVDAFRGHFLREHTKHPEATFILSHYHGDHYTQLPRDGKYRGPAKIHCTPITAKLLINVHLVSKEFVVAHEYGSTFRHRIVPNYGTKQETKATTIDGCDNNDDKYATITFYDANHCPGACIILIELPDGKTVHLHTGDMRYHPRFQSYPLLANSTKQRKLDLVYLDTTYCHPKHDFLTQDDAVNSIAAQTQQLLAGNSRHETSERTLVLLSCYSIGKEKVLYEASKRSNQLIYVSEKKWKMLRCIQEDRLPPENGNEAEQQQPQRSNEKGASTEAHQPHINILERCTRDPSASDLHVIPMGLAGEMWPYFQPNFQKIAKYVEELSSSSESPENNNENETTLSGKVYDKVVGFIPTGWADATNWNKKNAVSTKTVRLSSSRSLHVEVRLISYSEHSTFPELVSFVQYLKPRKVIPTVYSDESHKRQIEGRFRNMLDSTRAKQAFFRSMITKKKNALVPMTAIAPKEEDLVSPKEMAPSKMSGIGDTANEGNFVPKVEFNNGKDLHMAQAKSEVKLHDDAKENVEDNDEEVSFVRVVEAKKSPLSSASTGSSSMAPSIDSDKIDAMVSMGFDRQRAEAFLEKCHGNMQLAVHEILSEQIPKTRNEIPTQHEKENGGKKTQPSHSATTVKKRKISDFFAQRKK